MTIVAQILRNGPLGAVSVSRRDPRAALAAILWALSIITVLFVLKFGFDTYDVLVAGIDSESDTRLVTITVGPVTMTAPRNTIRDYGSVQGSVSKLDLRLHWPTMEGYSEHRAEAFKTNGNRSSILYVTLRPSAGVLSPRERVRLVYARLLQGETTAGPAGLVSTPFGAGHGYDGERLYTSADRDRPFIARCAVEDTGVPATCITEYRTAHGIDIAYRFRRHLLSRWRDLDDTIRATVASFMLVQ